MFLWRRRAIRVAFGDFAPDILDAVAAAHAEDRLGEIYPSIQSTSIDYAVMEPAARAGRVAMGVMDVGWTDLGSWTVLLSALGGRGSGRVVQAGGAAEADDDDLIIRRRGGRLTVDAGPMQGILDANGPSALLAGARADRPIVEALLARVDHREARS
jgi:mannose-1-phosphate guanylyltransferase